MVGSIRPDPGHITMVTIQAFLPTARPVMLVVGKKSENSSDPETIIVL